MDLIKNKNGILCRENRLSISKTQYLPECCFDCEHKEEFVILNKQLQEFKDRVVEEVKKETE